MEAFLFLGLFLMVARSAWRSIYHKSCHILFSDWQTRKHLSGLLLAGPCPDIHLGSCSSPWSPTVTSLFIKTTSISEDTYLKPLINELLQRIVATLVFALIVYLLFKSVGCFWKSDTGKTIRAFRGEDVYTYTCGTCGAVNSDAESDSGLFGTFRHGWTRVRGHSPTAPPAELVPLGACANLPPNREYRESRRSVADQPHQPDGRSNRQRDHRRVRGRAIPRHHNRSANIGVPVGIAQQIGAFGRFHDADDSGAFPHPLSFPSSDSAVPIREPAPLPRYTQAIAQRDEADGSNPTNTTDELGLSYEPSALETELRNVRVIRDD